MKRFSISLALLCITLLASAVPVTFRVNLSQQAVSPNGVHIAGEFQGWNPAGTPMTEEADGIYAVTLELADGQYQYKFLNGNAWGSDEQVPQECGVDNGFGAYNRSLMVTGQALELEAVCFSLCSVCVEQQFSAVTFSVNMNEQTVSPNGVHVAGSFQGWNPGSTPLTDANMDGVYEVTVNVIAGSSIQYKFINGNDWPQSEIVPGECGVNDGFGGFNRSADVQQDDMILPTTCFGGCENCTQVEPTPVSVTFQVDMSNQIVSTQGVFLTGNFALWMPAAVALADAGNGIYSATVELLPGDYNFRFANGNQSADQESVPAFCGEVNEEEGLVRYVQITQVESLIIPVVCYSECGDCNIPEPTNLVTFRVNMSEQTISPNGVHIAGNFQGWNPASTPLTDEGNGIWAVTVEVDEWANLNFKFINGNEFSGAESVPSSCGLPDGFGGYNRILETGSNDISFGPVCFGACEDCEAAPATSAITIRVNMSNETVSADGVHIAGDFQGWNPAGTPMTDEGNGTWSYTAEFAEGTSLQYKFINGNAWGSDESVPGSCNANGNRSYTVPADDTVLDLVCFGSCQDCGVEPEMVMVLFQVDMSSTTVSPNGVHVAGNFQGWNPNGTVMTELGGGIFEILYPVEANSILEFRFINGSNWPDSETVPSACGVDDGFQSFNRTLEVGSENTVYGPVCFSSCEACAPQVPVILTFRVNMNNENVSPDGVFVVGDFNGWDPEATMMSEFEPGVYQAVGVANSGTTIQYKFLNGPDFSAEESVPGDCGVPNGFGGFNRSFTAGSENEIIPVVCFSECADCTGGGNVNVTFAVDMSQQTVSPDGVHIAGSFNGFSATASPMIQVSPGVYHFTTGIAPNTQVFYKFINGNDFAFVESVPFECGVDDDFGGFNRTFTTPTNSVELNEVCFGSCADCTVNVEEDALANPFLYPNPASNIIRIRGNAAGHSTAVVSDCSGREVMRIAGVNADERVVDVSALSAGLYVLRFEGTSYRASLMIE